MVESSITHDRENKRKMNHKSVSIVTECMCTENESSIIQQISTLFEKNQSHMYEGVSKSSCTNAITFYWYQIPYQTFFHVLNRYISSSGAKFQQVASKYNKFMKF